MPSVANLANQSAYAAGSTSLTGAGAVRVAGLQPINLVATMQGQRVTAEHFYVVSLITPPIIQTLLGYFAVVLRETAKNFHKKNIDTGATYNSIQSGPVVPLVGGGAVDVWVSTPYSKFLEFGFVHYLSGEWIFNPFMIPAADLVSPYFLDAIQQVAEIAADRRTFTGFAATSPASGILQTARGGLYSYSKWAGDIQALGFAGLSGSRGVALKGAKGIGNIQAGQQGTLAARTARVVAGRVGGRFGRTGIVSGFSPGQIFSGPSARLYNRISGRAFGGGLSRIGGF